MVRDVMNDMEITDGMLGNIDAQLAEFQEISAVEWQQIGAQALDIALRSGVNPLGGVAADWCSGTGYRPQKWCESPGWRICYYG